MVRWCINTKFRARGMMALLVMAVSVAAAASDPPPGLMVDADWLRQHLADKDIVVLDVRMVDCDGLTALKEIKERQGDTPVLMLSAYDNPTYIARASALGASGYVLKGAGRDELLRSLRKVVAGQSAWRREDLRRVTGALATPRIGEDIEAPLTRRESEVLRQMALGLTNKEIALALHISYETVKEHVQHILRKVGVSDRTQAAVWAVRNGLV